MVSRRFLVELAAVLTIGTLAGKIAYMIHLAHRGVYG